MGLNDILTQLTGSLQNVRADIDDLDQHMKELLDVSEFFNSIFLHLEKTALLFHKNDRIVFANRYMYEMACPGGPGNPEDLYDKPIYDVVNPADHGKVRKMISQTWEKGYVLIDKIRLSNSCGNTYIFEVQAWSQKILDESYIIAVLRDRSEEFNYIDLMVRSIFSQLTAQQKMILLMVMDYPKRQMAEMIGVHPSTVTRTLSGIERKLRIPIKDIVNIINLIFMDDISKMDRHNTAYSNIE